MVNKRHFYDFFLNRGTLEQASPNIKDRTMGINLCVIWAYAESGMCLSEHPFMMTGASLKDAMGIEFTTS